MSNCLEVHDVFALWGVMILGSSLSAPPESMRTYPTTGKPLLEVLSSGRPGAYFVEAHGQSMNMAGISDGDVVTVDPYTDPVPGDIVVARINRDIALLRFDPPFLRSESDLCAYEYVIDVDDVEVLCVAVAKITVTQLRTT